MRQGLFRKVYFLSWIVVFSSQFESAKTVCYMVVQPPMNFVCVPFACGWVDILPSINAD